MPPWNRNEPDPLEAKRRLLEEQQRLLTEKISRLNHELQYGKEPVVIEKKTPEPPVWRLEDDVGHFRTLEPNSSRKRNLARQRQRDKLLFFLFMGVLFLAMIFFVWLWQTHFRTPE